MGALKPLTAFPIAPGEATDDPLLSARTMLTLSLELRVPIWEVKREPFLSCHGYLHYV